MTIHNPGATDGVAVPVQKAVVKAVAKRAPKFENGTAQVTVPRPLAPAAPSAKANSERRLESKKAILVRESFKLPMLDHLMLETLKLRGSKLGRPVKKSALVCAGINALAAMSDAKFLAMMKSLPSVRAGRPAKE